MGSWSNGEISLLKTFAFTLELEQKKLNSANSGALEDVVTLLGKWGMIAVIVGIVMAVVYIAIKPKIETNAYVSSLGRIMTGLEEYKSAYGRYPAGTGWGWDTNNAFVSQDIVNSGWQYSCSSNTIKITTPPIGDTKVRTLVQAKFQGSGCDSVSTQGNRVVCQLNNRPCW